jgi:hypothetical protein
MSSDNDKNPKKSPPPRPMNNPSGDPLSYDDFVDPLTGQRRKKKVRRQGR